MLDQAKPANLVWHGVRRLLRRFTSRAVGFTGSELHRRYVFGSWAFRTLTCRKGHFLAFMQVFERNTLDAFRVEEKIFSSVSADEPETFVGQLLDRAFRHLCIHE